MKCKMLVRGTRQEQRGVNIRMLLYAHGHPAAATLLLLLVLKKKRNKVTVEKNERLVVSSNKVPLMMYQLITMTICEPPGLCCTHNKDMSDPHSPQQNQTHWTLRGSLSGIDMVQILEVCLGMVQVLLTCLTPIPLNKTKPIGPYGDPYQGTWCKH